jgi:hypothetical protein
VAACGDFVYVPSPPVLEYRIHAGGASHVRQGALQRALLAVDAVFFNRAIRERRGEDQARIARRDAEAGVFALLANDRLREGDWPAARALLRGSIARRPWQVREWILLTCATARYLPDAVRRRLK